MRSTHQVERRQDRFAPSCFLQISVGDGADQREGEGIMIQSPLKKRAERRDRNKTSPRHEPGVVDATIFTPALDLLSLLSNTAALKC